MIAANPADIWLPLAIPLFGAGLVWLSGSMPNLRESVSLLTGGTLFWLVARLLPQVLDGERPALVVGEILPGLSLAFEVEPLGLLFALVASSLWIVTTVYSIGYMRGNNEANQTRFYICFAVALASAIGVAFSANLLTLFIFYETLTLSTYPLVTHSGTPEALRGGRVYLGVLLGTSIGMLLLAVIWTWNVAGTVDFVQGGILGDVSPGVAAVLLALFVFGIGKAALMPFHRWLPAAMVAPAPVSALLHAVAVVKAGVFSVVKIIVYIFGIDYLTDLANADWLVYVAGFTVIAASVIALRTDNLKRRLAYSTVSQLSYIIIAAAMFTPLAVLGAAMHIAAHALGKITLFFAAGSIYTAAHKTKVSQLAGIGRRMPWTMTAFAIAAISMIGLPPTVGFVSKWYIFRGVLEVNDWFVVGVLIASTLLNMAYFMPIVYRAFFLAPPDIDDHGEAPLPVVVALAATAAATVALFFFPDVPLALAERLVATKG